MECEYQLNPLSPLAYVWENFFLGGWSWLKSQNIFQHHHEEIRLGVLAGWGLRGSLLKNQQTNTPVHHLLKIFHPYFDAVSEAIWPLECDLKEINLDMWFHCGPGQAPKKSLMIASDAIVHGQVIARGVERGPAWFGSSIFLRVEQKLSSCTLLA